MALFSLVLQKVRLGKKRAADDGPNELSDLAEQRRRAAEKYRDDVIKCNMKELVDLLIATTDLLPCEAAEGISIKRIASSESDRTAADIMIDIPIISADKTVRDAATLLVGEGSPILAAVTSKGELAGVVTEWDITRATAMGSSENQPLERIMSRKVISAKPNDTMIEMVRKLEYHEISAMPVVDQGFVAGMVTDESRLHLGDKRCQMEWD